MLPVVGGMMVQFDRFLVVVEIGSGIEIEVFKVGPDVDPAPDTDDLSPWTEKFLSRSDWQPGRAARL